MLVQTLIDILRSYPRHMEVVMDHSDAGVSFVTVAGLARMADGQEVLLMDITVDTLPDVDYNYGINRSPGHID